MTVPTSSNDPARKRGPAHSATIYDVAREAGVNPSTVSRLLNGQRRVGRDTEARILKAVEDLGYQFNPAARAVRTGRTRTLGLVIADLTNPMFFEVLRGAERMAAERGYTLVIADSSASESLEVSAVERIRLFVDGLVLVTTRLDDDTIRELGRAKPLVVLNRPVEEVTCVVPDIQPGIDAALDRLQELGHSSLAYLSGPPTSWMSRARWARIMRGAGDRNMTAVEIAPNWHTQEAGEDALARVRAAGVTGVLAYNDLMALGLLRAAKAARISIPGDISLVGFDDIFGADLSSPSLSTVKMPLRHMGEKAVDGLLQLLDSDDYTVPGVSAPTADLVTAFVERESIGPARSAISAELA